MNILYIHGLDSKLNPQKRESLQKYGKIFAPEIDYYNNSDAIQSILSLHEDLELDVVIGSSMGGFAAYHISDILDKPALLFNPALKERSVLQHIPKPNSVCRSFKQFVIGQQDEVVKPKDTFSFLFENLNRITDVHIHLRKEMEHQVSLKCFQEELEVFFNRFNEAAS